MEDDRWLARRLRWLRRPLPRWLQEHLVLNHPDAFELSSWCALDNVTVEISTNSNRVLHRWILLLELLPVVGRALNIFSWQPTVHRLGRLLHLGRTYREVVVIGMRPRS